MKVTDFAKLHKEWVKIANKICRDSEAANDLVQEMYIKLIEIERVKGSLSHLCYNDKPNAAWVYRVIYNTYIDSIRRTKIETNELTGKEQHEASDDSKERHENEVKQMMSAIAKLNQNEGTRYECQWFMYYVSSGLSLRQIATTHNISVTKVYHAVKNAKLRLNELITKQNGDVER